MKVKKVYAKPIMTHEEAAALAGHLLENKHCITLYKEDVDIYDKETGKCLAKFRKRVIPPALLKPAYDALLTAATPNDARLTATAGALENSGTGHVTQYRIRADGSKSKQVAVPREMMINSGIIGYYSRTVRFPYCRTTAFNMHHFDKFKKAYPLIKYVDLKYAELMPAEYKKQRAAADASSPDFIIKDTSFSTVTVNKNYTTAVHVDAGDYIEGFGNLTALREGTFEGCYFTLVRFGVGFDMQNLDLLFANVHEYHGNTPMIKIDPNAVRLSLVMYYRADMAACGSAAQELKRVKERKQGEPLK